VPGIDAMEDDMTGTKMQYAALTTAFSTDLSIEEVTAGHETVASLFEAELGGRHFDRKECRSEERELFVIEGQNLLSYSWREFGFGGEVKSGRELLVLSAAEAQEFIVEAARHAETVAREEEEDAEAFASLADID